MTLDETIKEAKITAILFEKEACKCIQHGGSFCEEQAKAFRESAREFGQTAEWLEELKAYRKVYDTAAQTDCPVAIVFGCDECHRPKCDYKDCRRCRWFATDKCRECFGNELFEDSGYVTQTNCVAKLKGAEK